MDIRELTQMLHEAHQKWEKFIDEIPEERMEEPGVVAHLSMKDLIAHLNGWNKHFVGRFQAAQSGQPEPPADSPPEVTELDDINAWIYETNHERSLNDIRKDTNQFYQQIVAILDKLPNDTRIETIEPEPGHIYHRVWIGEKYYYPLELYYHYFDDHEDDVEAWLSKIRAE